MVSITNAGGVERGKQYVEYSGLSTDSKPSNNLLNGSVFFEIDTQDVYFYDEENSQWIKAGD